MSQSLTFANYRSLANELEKFNPSAGPEINSYDHAVDALHYLTKPDALDSSPEFVSESVWDDKANSQNSDGTSCATVHCKQCGRAISIFEPQLGGHCQQCIQQKLRGTEAVEKPVKKESKQDKHYGRKLNI